MLNLCIALYTEAQPFIEQLQLKKDERKTHFQIFEGEDARSMEKLEPEKFQQQLR